MLVLWLDRHFGQLPGSQDREGGADLLSSGQSLYELLHSTGAMGVESCSNQPVLL